jgi:hypothetical protein
MSDSCVYPSDFYDAPEFVTTSLRRARKPYRCGECGDPISVGDLYEYAAGKWDGRFSCFRTCARCVNVRTDYFPHGWSYGEMVQDWKETHGFDYRDGIPADFAPCRGLLR